MIGRFRRAIYKCPEAFGVLESLFEIFGNFKMAIRSFWHL